MTLEQFNKIARVTQATRAIAASNLFAEVISDYQRHLNNHNRNEKATLYHHVLLKIAKRNLDLLTFT